MKNLNEKGCEVRAEILKAMVKAVGVEKATAWMQSEDKRRIVNALAASLANQK